MTLEMTQLEAARKGKVTREMRMTAKSEGVDVRKLAEKIAAGRVVIPANVNSPKRVPCAIGEGLKIKVNANIGTSRDYPTLKAELDKLREAEDAGADTIMDLSTGGDIHSIRRRIISAAHVPVGTVPIYEAALRRAGFCQKSDSLSPSILAMTGDDMLAAVQQHGKDGVDFVTLHCGVTRKIIDILKKHKRVAGVVSRGGAILLSWMKAHGRENPLFERFDDVLDIARKHDLTLSLGDGLRPGAGADSFDPAQVGELRTLAKLVFRARKAGVQAMVEGPGHVPLDQVQAQIKLQKKLCDGAPFYVLGPLVTDVAPGYDHITSAIGGALAGWAGADFICYVTPAEHLGLPTVEHVREGVIAARIAGHAADIAKGLPGAREWDRKLSGFRRNRNWKKQVELSMDPKRALELRKSRKPSRSDVCSMCGELCVYAI
jgi:phosphomethylpyrimidine synthase